MILEWFAISEETDNGGFLPDTLEVASRNEVLLMREDGISEESIAKIKWISHQVEDRDSAILKANVPDDVAEWLNENALLVD